MIIGVTGTDGAGKGAVVKYLIRSYSYVHYSSRSEIEREISSRGLLSNRNNMRLVANSMRSEYGNDILVVRALENIEENNETDAIIESIRTIAEAETLRSRGGVLLAVDADIKKRFNRIRGRGSSSDKVSFQEFKEQEALEMNDPDPNGMQKAKVIEKADYVIYNNSTLRSLYRSVDDFLESTSIS